MNPWKEVRGVVWFLGLATVGLGLLMAFGEDGDLWPLPVMTAAGVMAVVVVGRVSPWLKWTDEGIYYRFVLKTRYVAWTDLLQVGVICEKDKKATGMVVCRNRIALLLPGGTPKKPDAPFLMKTNQRYILRLPNLPEYHEVVAAHYGSLDFDESVQPGPNVTVYNHY